MNLYTPVAIPNSPISISYQHSLFFIGSCFSSEMHDRFLYHGYQTYSNPNGTVYNSSALLTQLHSFVNEQFDFERFFVEHDGQWCSLLHNTTFRNASRVELLRQCESIKKVASDKLASAEVIFITLGTANVYKHKATQIIVANNQKLPAINFESMRLTVEDVLSDLREAVQVIRQVNSQAQLVVTVSPVRHKKDGFIQNQISKSIIRLAVDQACESNDLFYFPSYEIVLDELRDYRFYATDLVHINELGVNYIWEKLVSHLCVAEEEKIRHSISKFRKLEGHRVGDGEMRDLHKKRIEQKKQELQKTFDILIPDYDHHL